MPKHKSKKKPGQTDSTATVVIGVLLFIVTGIMPLVVRAIQRPIPPELEDLLIEKERIDAFAYWRGWLLMIPAFIILIYVGTEWLTGTRKFDIKAWVKKPPMIAAAIYVGFVILSSICSAYPYTAVHGTIDRFEGVFVQIAYMICFVAVWAYAKNPKRVMIVLSGLIFSSLLIGAVALSQLLKHDFITSELGSWLVTGSPGSTSTRYAQTYGTMFNPNTFGLYSAMLAPFLLIGGLAYRKNIGVNLLMLAGGGLMLIGVAASLSLGGFLGVAASGGVLVLVYVANRIYQRKWPHWLLVAAVGVMAIGGVLAYRFVPSLQNNLAALTKELKEAAAVEKTVVPVDYQFTEGSLYITRDGVRRVMLTPDGPDGGVQVRDGNGQVLTPVEAKAEDKQTTYVYDIPDYGRFSYIQRSNHFTVSGMFLALADGAVTPYAQSGKPIDISEPVPAWGFTGYETWGSHRGYIWSRALPLLLKYAVIGSGPDSFINVFPQDDIVGKLRFMYSPYLTVDKAHNLYLQTGITTGGISMLALIFLIGYYGVVTFRSLVTTRGEEPFSFGLRMGLLAAVSAYAIASLATDSTIPSSGVFWVMIGLGYALNARAANIKKEAS